MAMTNKVMKRLRSHTSVGDIEICDGWEQTKESYIIVQQRCVPERGYCECSKLVLLKKNL